MTIQNINHTSATTWSTEGGKIQGNFQELLDHFKFLGFDQSLTYVQTLLTSANVKDVFIYDTTKDSDGGAWRSRCQKLSWYNEPLNTATRGATREFPAVALIVAEDNKVTIYDATTVGCPMWMVFTWSGTFNLLGYASRHSTAVYMLNGVLTRTGTSNDGVYTANFIADTGRRYDNTNLYKTAVNIAQRVNTGAFLVLLAGGIINANANDVAMTVLDNTPIDPDTLLPVPTIAVGTNGGVSVIDGPAGVGTVVNITATETGFKRVNKISFIDKDKLFYSFSPDASAHSPYTRVDPIPSTNVSRSAYAKGTSLETYFTSNGIQSDVKMLPANTYVFIGNGTARDTGHSTYLSKVKADTTAPTNGMVSYITKSYNTGWMKGDIRRSLICDAGGTTDTLENLVTNGTFDTDTGWTKGADWTISGGVASKTAGTAALIHQSMAITGGKKYLITLDRISGTTGYILIRFSGTSVTDGSEGASPGTMKKVVTAPADATVFEVLSSSTYDGSIDNISVTEVINDRSVKATSLDVIGTLTREPVATGAELQCISGFGAGNYLKQDYSADLDFGTGDFYQMGWMKVPIDVTGALLSRTADNGVNGMYYYISSIGTISTRLGTGSVVERNTVGIVDIDQWLLFTLVRRDGVVYRYFNYTLDSSFLLSASLDTMNPLELGKNTLAASGIKLALWRMGAGSLTDEQIAEIYRTELPLFQPNAKCTLQGTSDAVQALDYDEKYNHLLVGTGDGVTTFNDLTVDDYVASGDVVAVSGKDAMRVTGSTTEAVYKK